MGTPKNMQNNALIMVGWLIIISSIVSGFVSLKLMPKLLHEFGGWDSPDIGEMIINFTTSVFQGLGLGLLCLFAAHQIKPFRGTK